MKLLIPLLLITVILLAGCDGPESWCKEPNEAIETRETRESNVTANSEGNQYTVIVKQSKWDCKDDDGHILYSTWIDEGELEPRNNQEVAETPGFGLVAVVVGLAAGLFIARSRL